MRIGKHMKKQVLHICSDGQSENVEPQLNVGFKYCPFCGRKYGEEETIMEKTINGK